MLNLVSRADPDYTLMPQAEYPRPTPLGRVFRTRTVLIPLVFMLLHRVVINLAAFGYALILLLIRGAADPGSVNNLLTDNQLQDLLLQQYPRIAVIQALILIPICVVFLLLQQRHDSRTVWLRPLRVIDILPALAMIIGALGVTNLLFALLNWLGQRLPLVSNQLQDYIDQANAYSPQGGYFWLILGISIMAPISEELLFRGIIQGELRKAMPEWLAVVIQALLFAVFHMQPVQILYVITPALMLGAAYAWTRSLWVPIIMHITFNFLGSVVPPLLGKNSFLTGLVSLVEIGFILVGILAALVMAGRSRREARPS